MKHFLCYDHTEDSKNLIPDGQEFLVEKPPEELYAKLEKALDKEFDKLIKIHFNIPLFLAAILSGGRTMTAIRIRIHTLFRNPFFIAVPPSVDFLSFYILILLTEFVN